MGMSNETLDAFIESALRHASGQPMTDKARRTLAMHRLEDARKHLRAASDEAADGPASEHVTEGLRGVCDAIDFLLADL